MGDGDGMGRSRDGSWVNGGGGEVSLPSCKVRGRREGRDWEGLEEKGREGKRKRRANEQAMMKGTLLSFERLSSQRIGLYHIVVPCLLFACACTWKGTVIFKAFILLFGDYGKCSILGRPTSLSGT
jgi:hypothetical protein